MKQIDQEEWYKQWFNTEYYHLLYKNRDEKEADIFISNLIKKLGLSIGAKLWDNACGRGRHAYFLSKYGYKVIGTDVCEHNIEEANKNFSLHNASFFVHDMRREFYVNYFDMVLNLFTSIGYFHYNYEEEKAIHVMGSALKKGGSLVIDFFNPVRLRNKIVPHETKKVKGIFFEIKRELVNEIVLKHIHIKDGKKKLNYIERVKLLPKDFFVNSLEKNGIRVKEIWGNYSLHLYEEKWSDRMIFWGEKI